MRLLLVVTFSAALAACTCGGGSGGPGTDGGTDAGRDAGPADAGQDAGAPFDEFDAWREMRGVVRRSPDAVPARADALVAAKDVEGLFTLVRDDVALLPSTPQGFDSANTQVRWGPRATLRGQAGTPRERAELLKALYLRAGFTAEVVVGVPVPSASCARLLARGPQRALDYPATAEQTARWAKVLPADATLKGPAPSALDPDGGVRA
ncbi:MAG: hypothetical protein K1X89_15380, partial [Myxococcaceae bacterium]|nr:hypothetical protein [Myxococcaceae bacterium]